MKTFLEPEHPRALLFDIDNTLYRDDSYVDAQISSQIRRFAEERGLSTDEARALIDRTKAELQRSDGRRPSLANTLVALGIPIADSVRWRRELIRPEDHLTVDTEVARVISRLSEHFQIGALTNNPAEIGDRTLSVLGIARFFRTVSGLDTAGESKPSWAPFEEALRALGSDVGETIMIGDRYDVDLEPVICRGGGGILIESRRDILALPDVLSERYALPGRA